MSWTYFLPGVSMPYSDCSQADELTRCLVAAYIKMNDLEIQTGGVVDDLHNAIMEHKASCPQCRRIATKAPVLFGQTQRVA
jgi:hypothetical protein